VGAEWALKQLPGISHVEIELTWEPPWNPSRMSQAARVALGFA
jgi:metal-sulfur cluster biosynthetic enzyme